MMKLLIGGSPCTYWSIAQTKNRETEANGSGWELFKNFLIALEKYKPNYFLYENNKSMSKAIRAQIAAEFGFEPVCINSAAVSAQNRQRLYWLGVREADGTYSRVEVEQPGDRGILLRDILESGLPLKKKELHTESQLCQIRGGQWSVRTAFPGADGGGACKRDRDGESPMPAGGLLQGQDQKHGGKHCGPENLRGGAGDGVD